MNLIIETEQDMQRFGSWLYKVLPSQCLIFLQGDLGVGKTTLVRGYLREAGFEGTVKSPTYNLVEEYHIESKDIYHFDLYRLVDPEELEWMGIRDYFEGRNLCFVEWPDRGEEYLPEPDINIDIQIEKNKRSLRIDINKNSDIKLPTHFT